MLKNILNSKTWKRNCPKCNKELIYSCRDALVRSTKINSCCRKCSNTLRAKPLSEETKKKISLSRKGSIPWNKNTKGIMVAWNKGKKGEYSLDYIKKLSVSHKGQKSPMEGKHHSEEVIKKLRRARCEWIMKNYGGPQYNPKACKYIDKLNEEKGWKLQHALCGGEYYIKELGYWVDGYDKEKKIIVEYDEPKHELVSKKEKDIKRQNEIIQQLYPNEFWRYNERYNELRRVL